MLQDESSRIHNAVIVAPLGLLPYLRRKPYGVLD
jgi:hypothetical protein